MIVTKGITLITEGDERVVVKEERVKLLETLNARVASGAENSVQVAAYRHGRPPEARLPADGG